MGIEDIPDKFGTVDDFVKYIETLLSEMEELVIASMKVQELYKDLVLKYQEDLEELSHYKRIVWGDNYEQY